jgi:hypothetical protein
LYGRQLPLAITDPGSDPLDLPSPENDLYLRYFAIKLPLFDGQLAYLARFDDWLKLVSCEGIPDCRTEFKADFNTAVVLLVTMMCPPVRTFYG